MEEKDREEFDFQSEGKREGDVFTLTSDKTGEDMDFVEIAGIVRNGSFYAIAQPVQLLPGMDEDEAMVFRVERDENGKERFLLELDDEVIDAVFQEYERLWEEAHKED